MIKINLVRESPATPTKGKGARKGPEFSLGEKQGDIILLAVIGIAAVVAGGRWYMLSSRLSELKGIEREKRAERDELQQYITKVDELEAKREALRQKIQVINDLKTNQRGPVRIMDEVSRTLPDLVWLTDMQLAGNDLTLVGMAMDENAVANYIANLDASPWFQEPILRSLARSTGESFSFTLSTQFTNAAPQIAAAAGS